MISCLDALEIEVGNDYDYHDAPPYVTVVCQRPKSHRGDHAATINIPHRRKKVRVSWRKLA